MLITCPLSPRFHDKSNIILFVKDLPHKYLPPKVFTNQKKVISLQNKYFSLKDCYTGNKSVGLCFRNMAWEKVWEKMKN